MHDKFAHKVCMRCIERNRGHLQGISSKVAKELAVGKIEIKIWLGSGQMIQWKINLKIQISLEGNFPD